MGKKNLIYDSETGDVMDACDSQEPIPVEPLRIPGIVEQFIERYIPAPSEAQADIVFDIANLRDELCCWTPFGCKEDSLQEYLDVLFQNGYTLHNTTSGPALCVISTGSTRVINVYDEAEEIEN